MLSDRPIGRGRADRPDVMRLVRAEWRKTLTTRLVWGMLAGYVLYTVTNAVANGVNTTITKGKNKRFGRSLGRRSDIKKAYVALKEGFDLDFSGAAE